MSAVATATALATAQAAQTAGSLSTAIIKQNHQADLSLIAMLQQAVDAGSQAVAKSDTAPGTGTQVDVSA
jgi:hypothetical protein